MKLRIEGANRTTLVLKDGTEIFFSYETPVAGFSRELGYFKSATKFSATTSKHIGQYLSGTEAAVLPQSMIEGLIGTI